jgi:hypothetical protein
MSDDLPSTELRKLRRLLGGSQDSEYELDLTGLDLAHSLASIDRMVERQRFRSEGRSVLVHLDPATATSGETLFQPIGQHLLALLRQKLIVKCRPRVGDKGSGFFLELPAKRPAGSPNDA